MMMGPEPIIRTDWMELSLGMYGRIVSRGAKLRVRREKNIIVFIFLLLVLPRL